MSNNRYNKEKNLLIFKWCSFLRLSFSTNFGVDKLFVQEKRNFPSDKELYDLDRFLILILKSVQPKCVNFLRTLTELCHYLSKAELNQVKILFQTQTQILNLNLNEVIIKTN